MNASHKVNPTPFRPALSTPKQGAFPLHSRRRTSAIPGASAGLSYSQPLAIESVAFAGVDMPVHLVVIQGEATRTPACRSVMVLDYAAFSRMLREKAPRIAAISVLAAIGARPTVDASSGCRNWIKVHIQDIIGSALALSTVPAQQSQPTQPIAA